MKKERVKSLGSKAFSNRMYTIKIDFYDHNMADATIDLKPWRSGRWHNHQHFCYIPFDECITESMYDYEECLQMLDLDKVARRWFIRQMRHCTEGLLRQDGRPDMDAAERKHDRLYHWTRLETTVLDERQKSGLLEICPEAGYNGQVNHVHLRESFPMQAKAVRARYSVNIRAVAMPTEVMLEILEKLFPQFYVTVQRDRDIRNCNVSLRISWEDKAKATMSACVQDNDFILYSKHA